MQVQETLSEGLKRNFSVVIPANEINDKRKDRLKELGRTMNMPGFRPGKVPEAVVQQRYGAAVQAEVIEQVVNESVDKILDERGLRAALPPKIDMVKGAEEGDRGDLEFKIDVDVMPEIELPDISKLSLTRLKTESTDEAVDTALKEIAKRQRSFEDSDEKRPAKTGDVLNVDFVGKLNGTPFDGGTAQDVNVELGGNGFIPGFAEQIEGMSPGEEKVITVTFPAEYQAAELAGKEVTFDIKANSLKKVTETAIDDDLAKKLGFPALVALKDMVSRQLTEEYDELSRMRLKRDILDELAEKVDFEVPETLVDNEFNQIWQRVEADKKADKLDEEDKGKDEETLKADYRKIALRRVRLGMLLAEMGRVNSISVTQDELINAMRQEAMRYPGQEQQVIDFFRQNPRAADSLRGPIFEDKVINYIIDGAKIKDKEVTAEQLVEVPPAKL